MAKYAGLHRNLNTLLAAPEGKWHDIFLGMHELAICVSSRIKFRSSQDCEDAISAAVIHAMEQLASYDARRQSAIAYFGRVMARHMLTGLHEVGQTPLLHDAFPDQDMECSILDRAICHHMPGRAAPAAALYRLTHTDDIQKVRNLLDVSLERSLAALENSAIAAEQDQARICLMVLQHIRKLLLGRFNRIVADHLRISTGAPGAAS